MSTLANAHWVELDEVGYTVIPDVLSPAKCRQLAVRVDEVWANEAGHPDHACDEVGVQFVGHLLFRSAEFAACVEQPDVLAAVAHVVGDNPRLSAMLGRRVEPGSGVQPLHDLVRRRGRPFTKCNTTWCLDAFTPDNGATRVLPGTHLDDRDALAILDDPCAPHPAERLITAPQGAVIVMNSHLIHAGSSNRSDRSRGCIHSAFVRAGEPTHSDWSRIPSRVQDALSPGVLALVGRD